MSKGLITAEIIFTTFTYIYCFSRHQLELCDLYHVPNYSRPTKEEKQTKYDKIMHLYIRNSNNINNCFIHSKYERWDISFSSIEKQVLILPVVCGFAFFNYMMPLSFNLYGVQYNFRNSSKIISKRQDVEN